MKNSKKNPRIYRYALRLFVFSVAVFLVSTTMLKSNEFSMNAKCKKVQQEITAIKSDIDGLKVQKQELSSFSRIKKVAEKKGYTYQQSSVSANVVGSETK